MSLYVDLVAILILVIYLLQGFRTGLWLQVFHLVSFVAALYLALVFYAQVGNTVAAYIPMQSTVAYAVGFIVVMILVQFLLGLLFGLIRHTAWFEENIITRVIALVPAFIDGVIAIALLVLVSTVLPLPANIAQAIQDSHTGKFVTQEEPSVSAYINRITGGALNQTVSALETHSEASEQPQKLSIQPSHTSVDTTSEAQMLVLVNQERAKVGVAPLAMDSALTQMAEAHSQDMWDRQYFGHIDPDGKSPADRAEAAGISYTTLGENIALAPTLQLAHTGLMNSPGHRANILNPAFHKVGIGIIDGGIYGKMVTQDFTN